MKTPDWRLGWTDGWNMAIKGAAEMVENELGDIHERQARAQAIREMLMQDERKQDN